MRKVAVVLMTAALAACAVGPSYEEPDTPVPGEFVGAGERDISRAAGGGAVLDSVRR